MLTPAANVDSRRLLSLGVLLTLLSSSVACSRASEAKEESRLDAGPPDAGELRDASDLDDAGPTDAGAITPDAGTAILGPRQIGDRVIDQNTIDLYTAACEWSTRCHVFRIPGADLGQCVNTLTTANGTAFNSDLAVLASVRAGKAALDLPRWRECLDVIGQQSCGLEYVGFFLNPACADAVIPKVGAGERCISNLACFNGYLCEHPSILNPADLCEGRCKELGADRCRRSLDCGAGKVCEKYKCVAPRPTGQAEGAVCGTGIACSKGLYCDSNGAAAFGSCKSLPLEGGACNPHVPSPPCADAGVQCVLHSGEGWGRCTRVKGVGEACTDAYDCADFTNSIMCDQVSHKCTRGPSSGPCGEYELCDKTVSFCDTKPDPPVCKAYSKLGEACEGEEWCGAFYPNAGVNCGRDPSKPHDLVCIEERKEWCIP